MDRSVGRSFGWALALVANDEFSKEIVIARRSVTRALHTQCKVIANSLAYFSVNRIVYRRIGLCVCTRYGRH